MPALHAITVDRLARIIGTPNAPIVIDLGPDTVRNTLPAVLSRSVATMPEWAGSIAGRSAIVICEDGGAASQGRYRSATPGGRECHRQRQAALINDHIDHCLVHAEEGEGPQHAIDQFRAISKYW